MKSSVRGDYFRLRKELDAGKLRNVYVFTGSENFLIKEMVDEVCARKLGEQGERPIINRLEGEQCTLQNVMDTAETVSMFGDIRIVVVDGVPCFAESESEGEAWERLLSLISAEDAASCVIFLDEKLDKKNNYGKKLIDSGVHYHFDVFKQATAEEWAWKKLKSHGIKLHKDVLNLLVERVGRDPSRLSSEVDKLVAYLGGRRELTSRDVLDVASRSLQGDIFALVDAVVSGGGDKALALLHDLLAAGEPPLRILAMLYRQFRLLGESVELLAEGCRPQELSERLGLHPYAAKQLARQADNISAETVSRALDLLSQADVDIKKGFLGQSLALEAIVVALGEKKDKQRKQRA